MGNSKRYFVKHYGKGGSYLFFLMTLVVWFIAQLVDLMNTPFDLASAWHIVFYGISVFSLNDDGNW